MTQPSEDQNPRPGRFLIAAAVAHHTAAPDWDPPGLETARTQLVSLFTDRFNYTLIEPPGMNPTAAQLLDGLARFCRAPERRADDVVAVYFTGHGERLLHTDEHVLITADTDPAFLADAPTTDMIARKILFGTPVRRLMLILDTCYSGKGGADFAAAALTKYTHHWSENDHGAGIVVISSTQPRQLAEAGEFPRLLTAAVESLSTAGQKPQTLSVQAVVTAMNSFAPVLGWQRIGLEKVRLTGDTPPFLPNPRHRPDASGPQAWLQSSVAEDFARRRDIEFRTRLLVRAMGNQDNKGWWFTGRHTALTDITTWLTNPDTHDSLLAVTGDPGSGKTAVLGLIAALTDSDYHHSVPRTILDLPAAAVPPVGVVDVVIYAQNLTTEHIRDRIAAAAHLNAEPPEHLGNQLSTRTEPLTVLIDALDEATDPQQLITKLLRPLLDHAGPGLRVLVGTRPYLLERLGTDRQRSIDLDSDRYADHDALTAYAVRGLVDAVPDTIYLTQPPTVIRAVADAIAERAGDCFLVARIVAATLSATPTLPDPTDPAWRRGLPRLPGEAMRDDLESRLGPDADKARALLLPLAFAQGQGLPWEDLWAGLASALAGVDYTDADLIWLRRTAGSYVVEATEAGRSVYRLYHQALADHLTSNTDTRSIHAQFVEVLRRRVPVTTDGHRDWARAHPYTLAHLATHAARADLIDEMVADIDYLVHADPSPLLDALRFARSDTARLSRSVYRCSADRHRHLPPARRRHILAVDAARFAATGPLRELNAGLEWPVQWATGGQVHHAHRATLTGHTNPVEAIACSGIDGQPVAVTSSNGDSDDTTIRLWDLNTGAERAIRVDHTDRVNAMACSRIDGRLVAITGGWDPTVRVWNLDSGTVRARLTGHTDAVHAVVCTTIESRPVALTGSSDNTVRVWNLDTETARDVLTGHTSSVAAVACTAIDGNLVAVTGSWDHTVRVWDLTTATQRAVLTGHTGFVVAVACTTIDEHPIAVTGSWDYTVRVWDLTTATERAVLRGHTSVVTSVVCLHVDGNPVAVTGSHDGTVRVWDLGTSTEHTVLTTTGSVYAIASTSIDGAPVVVTGNLDHTARVWDLSTLWTEHSERPGHDNWVGAIACTAIDGDPVAVTTSYQSLRVWDLDTGNERAAFTSRLILDSPMACAAIDGSPVAVTGGWARDPTARVWDLNTGAERFVLWGHQYAMTAVACTVVDGRAVAATGNADETVLVWDLDTEHARARLVGHTDAVLGVAWTNIESNPTVVTASRDSTVRVWDLTTQTQRAILTGHTGEVTAVACTIIDGQPIAVTAGDDNTVRVWDLTTQTQRAILTGHTGEVTAVACTIIDGQPIAVTAGSDATMRLWDLSTLVQTTVIDWPMGRNLAIAVASTAIVVGFGFDIAVLSRRSNAGGPSPRADSRALGSAGFLNRVTDSGG